MFVAANSARNVPRSWIVLRVVVVVESKFVISASQTEDAAIARESLYAILTLALLAMYSIVTIALIMKEQK